jgi:hypothetical protein
MEVKKCEKMLLKLHAGTMQNITYPKKYLVKKEKTLNQNSIK